MNAVGGRAGVAADGPAWRQWASMAASWLLLRDVVVLVGVVFVTLHVIAVDEGFYALLQVCRLENKKYIVLNLPSTVRACRGSGERVNECCAPVRQ